MSLETRIPKEIHDYREKLVFGLSARQLASVAAAVAVVLATGLPLYYGLGVDLKIIEYVLILEAMPIIAVGFIQYKGLPFEDYALIRLAHRFGTRRLLYKTDVDFLTSLYPIKSANERPKGAGSHEVSRKEKRRRRKTQRECLQEIPEAPRRGRRPRAARHQPREKS